MCSQQLLSELVSNNFWAAVEEMFKPNVIKACFPDVRPGDLLLLFLVLVSPPPPLCWLILPLHLPALLPAAHVAEFLHAFVGWTQPTSSNCNTPLPACAHLSIYSCHLCSLWLPVVHSFMNFLVRPLMGSFKIILGPYRAVLQRPRGRPSHFCWPFSHGPQQPSAVCCFFVFVWVISPSNTFWISNWQKCTPAVKRSIHAVCNSVLTDLLAFSQLLRSKKFST